MTDDPRAPPGRPAGRGPAPSGPTGPTGPTGPATPDAQATSGTGGALDHVRREIRALAPYSTGEQRPGFIKLNTNECAYEPSPRVRAALAALSDESLRLYPDPHSTRLRQVAAARFSVAPDQIIVGNGSDDCLTILCRTFLAPRDLIATPWPSYGLYDTLAGIQGAGVVHLPYTRSATRWTMPAGLATAGARVVVVANPNNPSSTLVPVDQLRRLAGELNGILIVDEAYMEFALGVPGAVGAGASMLPHLDAHPNLVVLRTFSKSYSLAGARLGMMFAAAPLVAEMNKVKDSYNVNAITQALGVAALEDRAHHADVIARTLREKARLEQGLATFGWTWPEAWGNFLLCQVGDGGGAGGGDAGAAARARGIFKALRDRQILVRYWDTPELRTNLRITVGAPEQNDALLAALRAIGP